MTDDTHVQTLRRALKAAGHDQALSLVDAILPPAAPADPSAAADVPAAAAKPKVGAVAPTPDAAHAIAAAEPDPSTTPDLTLDDVKKMTTQELADLSPEDFKKAQAVMQQGVGA